MDRDALSLKEAEMMRQRYHHLNYAIVVVYSIAIIGAISPSCQGRSRFREKFTHSETMPVASGSDEGN